MAKTNCEINGKQYFRLSKTVDGKRQYFYGSSERDAKRKYEKFMEERLRQKMTGYNERDGTMFSQRATEYVNNVLRTSCKYATGTKYRYERSYLVYLKECELSNLELTSIRPSDVQMFYNKLDVSSQTIKSINKFMSAFCKWSVLNGYSKDFMSAVEIPKKPDNKRSDNIVVWEQSEIQDILSAMDMRGRLSPPHRQAFFVRVLLYTGARIGEAVSLRYSDFENGTVSIQRQLYMNEIKPPKYGSSRTIPMHDELKELLPIHRQWHLREMQEQGYTTPYVFTTSKGTLYNPVNIRRALARFYEAHGIPYKHPHAYRATFCTQLCRCGVPLETASALMGHKSVTVTAKHYALVKDDTKRDAIKLLHYDI